MRVSLFIPCLVDQFYPQVGLSTLRLFRKLGLEVVYPSDQTCCGQPAFNSGYHEEARKLAVRFLRIFSDAEYIVTPSGSCASMVRVFYQDLSIPADLQQSLDRVKEIIFELAEFLVDILKVTDVGAAFSARVTYHDSCHLLRELKVKDPPRALIRNVKGIDFIEMPESSTCCGFGGAFSIKFPEISTAMLEEKVRSIQRSGAEYVVASDAGCLMHIAGLLLRSRIPIKTLHLAELLAVNLR